MGSSNIEVPLLTIYNYWDWSDRMFALLVDRDLEAYIAQDLDAGMAELPDAERREYRRKDRMAMYLIRAHVSPAVSPMVRPLETAKDTWDVLQSVYESILKAKRPDLEEQLVRLKMDPAESVLEYCGRAERLRQQLQTVAEPVSDTSMIAAVLRGLSAEYNACKDALRSKMGGVTVQHMAACLLNTEERLKSEQEDKLVKSRAAATKGRNHISNGKCFNCQKVGHMKRDCPEKRQKNESQWRNVNQPRGGMAFTAVADGGEEIGH